MWNLTMWPVWFKTRYFCHGTELTEIHAGEIMSLFYWHMFNIYNSEVNSHFSATENAFHLLLAITAPSICIIWSILSKYQRVFFKVFTVLSCFFTVSPLPSLFSFWTGIRISVKAPSYLHLQPLLLLLHHRRRRRCYQGSSAARQMGGHQPVFFLGQTRNMHSPLVWRWPPPAFVWTWTDRRRRAWRYHGDHFSQNTGKEEGCRWCKAPEHRETAGEARNPLWVWVFVHNDREMC